MASKLSLYLSDEAVHELDRLADRLSELSGCEISRSAAVDSLLREQAAIYVTTRQRLAATVAKYQPGGRFGPAEEEADDPGEHFMDGGRFGYDWGPYAEGEEDGQ